MKYVVLSADGDRMVYLVPDAVAEDLERYCMDFCDKWLWESPEAARYRNGRVVCYNEGSSRRSPPGWWRTWDGSNLTSPCRRPIRTAHRSIFRAVETPG